MFFRTWCIHGSGRSSRGSTATFSGKDRKVKPLNVKRQQVTTTFDAKDGKGMTREVFESKARETGEAMGKQMWEMSPTKREHTCGSPSRPKPARKRCGSSGSRRSWAVVRRRRKIPPRRSFLPGSLREVAAGLGETGASSLPPMPPDRENHSLVTKRFSGWQVAEMLET